MFYSTTSPKPEDEEQDRGLIGLLLLSRWFEKVFSINLVDLHFT